MVSCACWTNLVYPKIWSPPLETVTANSSQTLYVACHSFTLCRCFFYKVFTENTKLHFPQHPAGPHPPWALFSSSPWLQLQGRPLPPWAFEVDLNWSFALSLPLLQPPAILLLSVQCTHHLYPNPRLVGRMQRPSAVLTICHSRCVFSLQGLSPASPFTGGLLPPCLVSSLLAFIFKPELQISHFSF